LINLGGWSHSLNFIETLSTEVFCAWIGRTLAVEEELENWY